MESDYIEYHESIKKLEALENMSYIGKERNELIKHRLTYTMNMCKKLGITEEDFLKLNMIHITGSKGKGSTCAFIESILRSHGYRTGLISSPHLIEVKERVKINGKPLNYKKFKKYVDHCYDMLVTDKKEDDDFENVFYYQFLTILAFYIFTKEDIDVAIVEVGIGGEYDFTNIIPNPVACGITSLQLDHCDRLGNTIEEIAWHKSGILKSSCVGFTIETNIQSTLNVIKQRADSLNIPLCLVPINMNKYYDDNKNEIELGLKGDVQYINSSLAIQISKYWIDFMKSSSLSSSSSSLSKTKFDKLKWINENTFKLLLNQNDNISLPLLKDMKQNINSNFKLGLEKCFWPGRNQIIKCKNNKSTDITYYIDGAHTIESIDQFIKWFKQIKQTNNHEKNVLLFNYTGDRDSYNFLEILLSHDEIKYDKIAFSQLQPFPNDFKNVKFEITPKIKKELNQKKLIKLVETYNSIMTNQLLLNDSCNFNKPQIFDNIYESLLWLTDYKDINLLNHRFINSNEYCNGFSHNHLINEDISSDHDLIDESKKEKINVLITGSLYLVGLSLEVLDFHI